METDVRIGREGGREDRKGVGRGEEEEEGGTGDRHRDRGRQRQGEYNSI